MENKPIRHGELLLMPVKSHDMTDAVIKKDYIASHSETGHHHIIAGNSAVLERPGSDTYVELSKDSEIQHKKTTDKHQSLPVKKGIYKLIRKQEYDPFQEVMRQVWD